MGRRKEEVRKLRVYEDPNCVRYQDTNYYISKLGEIWSSYEKFDRKLSVFNHAGRNTVKMNGKKYNATKLIYETFIGKLPDGYIIIRKNGARYDMNINNLIAVPRYEFLRQRVTKNYKSRYIINLDNGDVYKGLKDAVKRTGYSNSYIRMLATGRRQSPFIHLKYGESMYPRFIDEA